MRWRDLCQIRNLLLAALVGVFAGAIAEAISPERLAHAAARSGQYENLVKFVETVLGFFFASLPDLTNALGQHPGLPIGVVAFSLTLFLFKFTRLKTAVAARFLADPPPFLSTKWETDESDDLIWSGRNKPFVGRKFDLQTINEFAEDGKGPRIWNLCGQSGLGKSHLAASWLKQLYAKGWDVGYIARSDSADLPSWRPRANTAILFDRVSMQDTDWAQLAAIVKAAEKSRRQTRVLLISHAPALPPASTDASVLQCLRDCWFADDKKNLRAPHILQPVDTSFVHEFRRRLSMHDLAESDAKKVVKDAGGLTLYVAIKAKDPRSSPRRLIVDRANASLARAKALGDFESALAISALAGPCNVPRYGSGAVQEPDSRTRNQLFPWEARNNAIWPVRLLDEDQFEIPAYVPELEGDEVVLSFLAALLRINRDGSFDKREATDFVERTVQFGGERVLDRILSLLCRHPLLAVAWRRSHEEPLVSGYHAQNEQNAKVAAILVLDTCLLKHRREDFLKDIEEIKLGFYRDSNECAEADREQIEVQWQRFTQLSSIGVNDCGVGLPVAQVTVNAVSLWGGLAFTAHEQSAFERIGTAFDLVRLLAEERFPNDAAIALAALHSGSNAVNHWGRFDIEKNASRREVMRKRVDEVAEFARSRSDDLYPADSEIGYAAARCIASSTVAWRSVAETETGPIRDAACDRLESAFNYLIQLAGRFPERADVALEAIGGVHNSIASCANLLSSEQEPGRRATLCGRLDRFFEEMCIFAGKYSDESDFNGEVAQIASGVSTTWGEVALLESAKAARDLASAKMEKVFAYLRELSQRFPGDQNISDRAAAAASNLTQFWGRLATEETQVSRRDLASSSMEKAFSYARGLTEGAFRSRRETALIASRASNHAGILWGRLAESEPTHARRQAAILEMERAFDFACSVFEKLFPNDPDLAVRAAENLTGAIGAWAPLVTTSDDKLNGLATERMEKCFIYLRNLADYRFAGNSQLNFEAAKSAYNIGLAWIMIAEQRPAQRSAAVRRITDTFTYVCDLADNRFPGDPNIGLAAAKIAYNSGLVWERMGQNSNLQQCRDYIRKLSSRLRDPEIDYFASQMNVLGFSI